MRKIIFTVILAISILNVWGQSEQFINFNQKLKQNFNDKGYKLASETMGKIVDTLPLVSDTLMLEADTYYNIVATSDNCSFCIVNLYFVDSENNMFPLDFEVIENYDDRFNYRIYKTLYRKYDVGRFVLMIKSDIPYDMDLLVYKKMLP